MARTSPQACCCFALKFFLPSFYFERWCRSFRKSTPILSSTRVRIGAGKFDSIIPGSETKQLAELLRNAGADVMIRFFQGGHGLTPGDVDVAREWLAKLK